MNLLKKYRFLIACLLVNLSLLIFDLQTGIEAFTFTGRTILDFLFMLTPVFICVGLMDVWIKRETMVRIMGDRSGVKGMIIALLMGMVTAVPVYALLPLAAVLLNKGCRISNVLIFLCASAAIRVPLLLFELSSLGWEFTFTRFGLNIIIVFLTAFLIERLLSSKDKRAVYDNVENLNS